MLADANSLSDPNAVLTGGTQLKAPKVSVNSNDATTFKPYDPSEAIGSTAPGLPYITPPPAQHCNVVAMIVIIVVAIVVTWCTAGAAATYFGPMMASAFGAGTVAAGVATAAVAGFVGGVAGSIASQAVGSALGVSHFSWKQVAVDGVTSAVTAGAGAWAKGVGALSTTVDGVTELNTAGRVVQGVASYAGGVVGNAIVGRDANFSWKAVASTVVSSYLSAKLGGQVPLTQGGTSTGRFINDFAGQLVNGSINAATRQAFGLGKADWGQVAVDAFGNALGNAAVGGIHQWQANRASAQQLHDVAWADGNPFNDGVVGAPDGQGLANAKATGAETFGLGPDNARATVEALPAVGGGQIGAGGTTSAGAGASGNGAGIAEGKLGYGYPVPVGYDEYDPELASHTIAYVNSVNAKGGSLPAPPDDWEGLVNYNHELQKGLYPTVSAAELPAIENLYTPRVGYYENAYNTYAAGLDDASAPFGVRAWGAIGATLTLPLAIPDMMVSGLYNAPNNAGIAGQYAARGSLLSGPDSNLAYLHSASYGINAFLGIGDIVTLGQAGAMSRARAPFSVTGDVAARSASVAGTMEESLSQAAIADQIASGYAADVWSGVTLKQGSVIYALRPGTSAYFTDFSTMQGSRLDSYSLSQALQVKPHDIYGYRPDVAGFRVTQDLFVPGGQALANPNFGPGGGTQFFIQNSEKYLDPITTVSLKRPH